MKNKLFSNSMIYIVSLLFNKGLTFLLLPVLTFYLTKEDYGVLGIVTAISTIASIYVGFFPSIFILSKYSHYGKEKLAEYIHHIFILSVSTTFLVLIILILTQDYLLSDLKDKTFLMVIITLYALFSVFFKVLDTIIQVEQKAIKFAILQTFQSVTSLGLGLLLIIEFSWGWKGKYYAELLILFLVFLYALYYIFKNDYYKFNTDYSKLKELVSFLFPLTFSVLGLYILGTIDRIFVANMLGLESAGIYNVAITMAIIINMVYDSIHKAISPIVYENLSQNELPSLKKVVKLLYIYSIVCIFIYLCFVAVLPFVFSLMIDIKFEEALVLIPILAFGLTFEGLRKAIESPIVFKNKVKSLAFITIIASALNIVLNYYLIKIYGINGAAYATVASFFVLYLLTFVLLLKHTKLPWLLKG